MSSCYAIHITSGLCFSQEALLRSKQVCWLHQFEKIPGTLSNLPPSSSQLTIGLQVGYTSLSHFTFDGIWRVNSFNDVEHLSAGCPKMVVLGKMMKDSCHRHSYILYQGCVCSCHFNVSILFLLMLLMLLCLFCLNRWLSVETVSLRTKKLHSPVHSENSCCDLGHQGAISMCFFSKCQTHLKR